MMHAPMADERPHSSHASMTIDYATADVAWRRFDETLRELASREAVRHVCELGGGAQPALSTAEVAKFGLDYTVVDVSADELERSQTPHRRIVADVAVADAALQGPYDLVISRFLAEHIPDAAMFHRNVHAALVERGLAFHFFPTLYALPFVLNRLVPAGFTERALPFVQSADCPRGEGKWPAYYRWCRGPTGRQLSRLRSAGFEIVDYTGFFGHHYYRRLPPLERAEQAVAHALARRPLPTVTSYAQVLLRRRGQAAGGP